jgi:hypothetical protein
MRMMAFCHYNANYFCVVCGQPWPGTPTSPPERTFRADCPGPTALVRDVTLCVHRGREARQVGCETCGGNVRVKVFACAVHGECSIEKPVGVQVCRSCVDHEWPANMIQTSFVINLDRRADKWQAFQARCPAALKPTIKRFSACDYQRLPPPRWWTSGGGAWGCYRSHFQIVEQVLNTNAGPTLLLEDDAIPVDDFDRRLAEYLAALPDDWGLAYLGGQLLWINKHPPKRINDKVYRPFNVNRTHAYMIRPGKVLEEVYRHLADTEHWARGHHVDHHLGLYHQIAEQGIYCPAEWLFHQAAGRSDVNGREKVYEQWPAAISTDGHIYYSRDPTKCAQDIRITAIINQSLRVDLGVLKARIMRYRQLNPAENLILPYHERLLAAFPEAICIE